MSSEQEESADHLDEPSASSSTAENTQSFEKKDNGLNEHAKPRRRRRGKKRKHKKESAATCEAENHDECESELHEEHENNLDCTSPTWNSDENLSCDVNSFTDVIIRPVNVPKAPENSTQFIMDDHNDCRFYMSFETPNPYLADPPHPDGEGDIIEPEVDAAYIDIDYQYESPQDFDNSAYYDREFELSYKSNRFDELMRLSRPELISALQNLEVRLKELSDDLVKVNPSPILEKLQAELLELQEKNSYLKESNSKFTAVLFQNETDCSKNNIASNVLREKLSPTQDDHGSHDEDSDGDVYQQCNEPLEIEMKGISTEIEAPNLTCDKNSLNSQTETGTTCDQLLPEQTKSNECSMTVSISDDERTQINSNSCVTPCQPNNIVKDDIRTLGINNSDIFHIAKCSSAVPLEGGMSPSETSVN